MKDNIRELRDGDLEYLAEHLREADVEEVLVSSGTVLDALKDSVQRSYYVRVIDFTGKPAGILGLADYDPGRDAIWMLGTPEIEQHSQKFLRNSKPMIEALFKLSGADQFVNFTYAKNVLHHRWLKWCGALFAPEPVDIGPDKKPFFPFVIERKTYV